MAARHVNRVDYSLVDPRTHTETRQLAGKPYTGPHHLVEKLLKQEFIVPAAPAGSSQPGKNEGKSAE